MSVTLKSSRNAFTLIELLVVIAIIAILAAILFPVFTMAKESSQLTTSLSNIKNIGLAYQMYNGDNEAKYLTIEQSVPGYCDPRAGDAVVRLAPYIKNYSIWFDPSRRDRRNPRTASPSCPWNPKNYLLGYGSNLGVWRINDNNGMYKFSVPGAPFGAAVGVNESEVEDPAKFIIAGTTNDYPYYTLSLFFQDTEGTGKRFVRFSGRWPYVFSDGHAKTVQVGSYRVSGASNWTVLHKKKEDMIGFCVQETAPTGFGYDCKELINRIMLYRTPVP
jgi:prepilin-type N-terminal cleavage/methylation domain-containing protein